MNPSPPARAVEQTLHLWLKDRVGLGPLNADAEAGKVQVLSFQEHFEHLWGVDGQASPLDATAERTLVLVYDGVPRGEEDSQIDVSSHVTAYDWLVYALLEAGRRGGARPSLRVLLLDLMGNRRAATFGEQTALAFLPLMPWVQVHRLFSLREAQRLFYYAVDVGFSRILLHVVAGGGATMAGALDDQQRTNQAARVMKDLWRGQLLKPGDRHSLSNLVAPLLLERGFSVLSEDGDGEHEVVASSAPRKALIRLMHALDLVEQPSKESDATASRSGYLTPPLRRRLVEDDVFGAFTSPLRVLLVDDDAPLGYDTLIRRLFNEAAGPRARVLVETSPKNLVDALSAALQREPAPIDWRTPRLFELPEGGPDLLLLDLRLFGEQEGVLPEEQRVLERLLGLFNRYFEEEQVRDEALLLAVGEARERLARGRSRSLRHLALLPLLLAHFDPSLPVVLFSSTRQRELLDLFRDHPNIVPSFGKPAITGYESGSPEGAVEALCDAIAEALRLHEARTAWRRMIEFEATHRFTGWLGSTLFGPKRLKGDHDVQRRLRDLYVDYVLTRNYYDLALQPYQLVQNGLVGERVVRRGQRRGEASFKLHRQEYLWPALGTLRNRVAHGYASRRPLGGSAEDRRLVSIAMLHLLLDMLGAVREARPPSLTDGPDRESYLAYREQLTSPGWPLSDVRPNHLDPFKHFVSRQGISWLDVFLFSALYNIDTRSRHLGADSGLVSSTSARALSRMLERALRRPLDHHSGSMSRGATARGRPYTGTVSTAPGEIGSGNRIAVVRLDDDSLEQIRQVKSRFRTVIQLYSDDIIGFDFDRLVKGDRLGFDVDIEAERALGVVRLPEG